MNIYQQQILDHYQNPKYYGKPRQFTHSFRLQNLSCGDEIEVYLTIDSGKITAINYVAEGCAISIASADMHAQNLVNKTVNEIARLSWEDAVKLIGVELTASRTKCAHLALEAIQKASIVN